MKTRQHTAENWVAGDPNFVPPAAMQQPANVRVVQGDNQPAPARWTVVGYMIMLLPVLALAAAIRMSGLSYPVTLIVIAIGGGLVGVLVLIVGNGDFPAWREVARTYSNEVKRMRYLDSQYTAYIALESNKAEYMHAERMAEIQTNAMLAEVHARLRVLEDRQHVGSQITAGPASPGFVPAETSGVRRMVAAYILGAGDKPGLYTEGGLPSPRRVAADGRIMHRVPWSARGEWRGREAVDAMDVLMAPAPGAPALVREERVDGKLTGYHLNVEGYPTKADAIRVLGLA